MADVTSDFSEEKTSSSSFDLRSLLLNYRRYWYLFLLSIPLAFGIAYLYLRYTTPLYLSTTTLLIKEQSKSAGDKILNGGESSSKEKNLVNEVELLKSRSIMTRVVDELNLAVTYFKQGNIRNDEEVYDLSPIWIYPSQLTPNAYTEPIFIKIIDKHQYELQDEEGNSKGKYVFNQDNKSEYGTFRVFLKDTLYQKDLSLLKIIFKNSEQIAQQYKSKLLIALQNPLSTVLIISIEDPVPAKGRAILNKLVEVYNLSASTDKNLEASKVIKFIDERLRLITSELNSVEQNAESFKSSRAITDLSSEGSMFLSNVNSNDSRLNEAELQLQLLDGLEKYLKSSKNAVAPASLNDPILGGLLHKLEGLLTQQEKNGRTMQANNPFMQNINGEIETTRAAIQENIDNQRKNLVLNRANLQQLNSRFESSIRNIPRKEREFIGIKRQQSIKESLYLLLLQKKEETAISYASTITDSRVIDSAYSTPIPLKPNPDNIYLVAVLLGIFIPAGGITARVMLSHKVRTRNEIENETGLTVFGEIMSKPNTVKENIIDFKSNQIIAEQFKVLRANLPYTDGRAAPVDGQVMLVTSSIVGEGKTFFTVNMASSLAQLDKRVIILELDLRKPKTSEYLGFSNEPVVGVSDYLNGQNTSSDIVRPTNLHPNLSLISSGSIPPNPAELLSNGRIGILLKELRQQFDYIILDTPPVAYVADTIILGPYADKAFYIVRHQYTPRNCMQLLTNLATSQKFKSLNIIFNDVASEKNQAFGYGYGNYM